MGPLASAELFVGVGKAEVTPYLTHYSIRYATDNPLVEFHPCDRTNDTAVIRRNPRVVAIIPIVIDVLNIEPSMLHHYAAYGFWAPAIQDYVNMGIPDRFGTPPMAALMEIEAAPTVRSPHKHLSFTGDVAPGQTTRRTR